MVILVVGRSKMPALVQRALVILVGREVTRTSDRTLAVSDLDRRNQLVDLLVIVCEIAEITERRSRLNWLMESGRVFKVA